MKLIKKFSKVLSIFLLLLFPLQTLFTTNVHAQEKNFNIIQNGNDFIIEENGSKHIMKIKEEPGKITSYMLDENDNVEYYFINDYENKTFYSSITNKYISLNDDFYDTDETFDISNSKFMAYAKPGSKENPYRYCTPGARRTESSKLSYAEILGMVGAGASAATITTALISRFILGVKVTTQVVSNMKVIGAEVFAILSSVGDHTWLANHGIAMNFTYVCSLQHYVDNAWGDNEWFYGEQVSTVSYSKY